MQAAWKAGDRARAMQAIEDSMVDALGVIGTAEACRQKVEDFVAAGVDMPIILPFSPDVKPAASHQRSIEAFHVSSPGVKRPS